MSKIVIDARELRRSTGRYVERLIHYLQQVDQQNDYIILLTPKDMDTWQPTNPRFTKLACQFKEFTFAEQIGYKRQLDSLHADLVHFGMVQQPVLYRGKVVTTMQDLTTIRFRNPAKNWLVFTLKRWVYIWVNKRVAHKSAAIITPTDFVRQDVAAYTHVDAGKITVTHEAADDFDEAAAEIPFFVGKTFIMSDGRPRPHKNMRRVIEAFAVVHEKHPDIYLMLTGRRDDSFGPYQQLIDKLGLHDHVVQTDFIPDGQLKWAMQHAQAFVWASLSEGFGLPPLEAMIHDAPVVSSNASCMPEVLGEAAQYFDPFDVTDIAAKIGEVLDDAALRKKLIANGKKQVQKYSWKRMAQQTLAVYNDVLKTK